MGIEMAQTAAEIGHADDGKHDATQLIKKAFAQRALVRGPKYLHLCTALAGVIERGVLPAGSQLPSDDEIASHLGLSVGTVQKAMHTLREDGILERRQGRGTFVVDPSIDSRDIWHFRFLDDHGVDYLPLTAKAIKCSRLAKTGRWSDYLTDAETYVQVTRTIDVNKEFKLLSDFYFDGDRFGDLVDEPLETFNRVVLRNILVERYGVRSINASQYLSCQELSARERRQLSLGAGAVGMVLETFGTDQDSVPIYYQRVVIPQSHRRLVVDQKP